VSIRSLLTLKISVERHKLTPYRATVPIDKPIFYKLHNIFQKTFD